MEHLRNDYQLIFENGHLVSMSLAIQIKCSSVKSQMNLFLTPESICELDTFTLEEHLEQLDRPPLRSLHADIIRIAKLELIDRLEIEQFGRQLANDQYKIDLDFHLPSWLNTHTRTPPTSHPHHHRKQQKQLISKLQVNMAAAGSFLTIGRPAVNHHYKPKVKKIEPIDRPKQFLRSKKGIYSKPKPADPFKLNRQEGSKQVGPKIIERKERPKIVAPEIQQKGSAGQYVGVKEELSLKEKLKMDVRLMEVAYRENDVYDDIKGIQIIPLNLKEEQAKILNEARGQAEDTTRSEIVEGQSNKEMRSQHQNRYSIEFTANESELCRDKIERKDQEESVLQYKTMEPIHFQKSQQEQVPLAFQPFIEEQEESQRIANIQSTRTTCQDNPNENREDYSQSISLLGCSPKTMKTVQLQLKKSLPEQSLLNLLQNKSQCNKEVKSKSLKSFHKKVVHNIKSDLDQCQMLATKFRESLPSAKDPDLLHKTREDTFKKTFSKIKTPVYQSNLLRSIIPSKPSISTFPYHQIIPTFAKLFPHSKNLLLTLRTVEDNLLSHFDKKINQKSRNDQYLKLDQNEMTFKIVSESQKAKRYGHLFNISLDSFFRRGSTMMSRLKKETESEDGSMLFYRVVRTKEEVYDIINSSFHRTTNWYQLPHGLELKNSWNLLWTWSKPQIDFNDLLSFQKVNHFIGNKQIARKDLLKKNIEKIQKLGNKVKQYFDIIPETFLLPGENIQFIKKFREQGFKDPLNYWILKPVGLSRGRGISLVNKLEDVVFSEPVILQKYIMNPLLVDGFKFDMRIYVLVTSINPLEAFLYNEGFARLSTEPYSLSEDAMDNKFIHLTNFSIQRENKAADRKSSFEEDIGGSKISLKMLSQKLRSMKVEWLGIQKQIEDIILKSLIASMNAIPQNPNCFELFGYDIFIDSNLKCWLLQINSSPSLEKQYMLDQIIKQQLVDDIIEVVNPLNYDRQRLLQVVGRRRREAEGLKSSINTNNNSIQQLNEDLHYLLHGQQPRKYGAPIENQNFKMLAPSDSYQRIVKYLQQYKIDPIVKKDNN